MPAMSPTMTEGNIASWKVKEGIFLSMIWLINSGETFSAGDVLLEIETDKAQMDVEAQDNGILAKILVPNGSQKVNVGKVIAVLAEEGDDISSLEMPSESSEKQPSSTSSSQVDEGTKEEEEQATISHKAPHSVNGSYPPAVLRLLQEHGIDDPKSIPTTGPQGRLLKGDVLAYVGSIKSDILQILQKMITKKQNLDLSNVVVQQPSASPKSSHSTSPPAKLPTLARIDAVIRMAQIFKVQSAFSGSSASELLLTRETFSISVPINSLIEKASRKALEDVPTFGLQKISAIDRIFTELVGESTTEGEPKYTSLGPQVHIVGPELEIAPLTPNQVELLRGLFGSRRYLTFEHC
jgi:pyruvate/2-oxoglutarate dehydrogenase complex dihydrolipoamide acyltransferase (E2) component